MKKGIFIKNGVDMHKPDAPRQSSKVVLALVAGFYATAAFTLVMYAFDLRLGARQTEGAAFDPCAGMQVDALPNGHKICSPPGMDLGSGIKSVKTEGAGHARIGH